VVTDAAGLPSRLRLGHAWHEVTLARRPWRVEQHWWREDPMRRDYFRVMPVGIPALTVYHDLVTGKWARQEYLSNHPTDAMDRTTRLKTRQLRRR
jgi:hypothetical protein